MPSEKPKPYSDPGGPKFKIARKAPLPVPTLTRDEAQAWLSKPVPPRGQGSTISSEEDDNG